MLSLSLAEIYKNNTYGEYHLVTHDVNSISEMTDSVLFSRYYALARSIDILCVANLSCAATLAQE